MKTIDKKETVILLHGIAFNRFAMMGMERYLKRNGFHTLNISYPSTKHDINTLSQWLHDKLEAHQIWQNSDKIHIVAHSMGGLIGGFYLQDFQNTFPAQKLGRFVMLGTPNGGSEVANGLKDFWFYKLIFGPAGQELTTQTRIENRIKPYYDLGVISGTKNWLNPIGRIYINGSHDGCVSVESTKIEGMHDQISLPLLHTTMIWSQSAYQQVLHFLQHGTFDHTE